MDQVNYRQIKENLPDIMEKVCNNHQPIIITRDHDQPVVLMSLADFSSY
ncbi:hypothetical protein cce_0343 [Crocosphaera subtropica ATCC 51142]|uniref:Antitoxin n=1 Tax=Crocosphaera subtropica (strain ATCC 51142 / BH68) TaxID=43989 RepID=B1X153_CROS5|nr:type II toxin-antitoxin system Phd/YefM family antitoxin [Crocosphaera subtropica]ACB49694.1 hypothetical protein cce_0343 [Crocosphaera subtropica ATCC 51142]